MYLFAISFLVGVCGIFLLKALPSIYFVLIGVSILTLLAVSIRKSWMNVLLAAGLGFAWVILFSAYHLSFELPASLEGKTLQVIGQIISLPDISSDHSIFVFQIDQEAPEFLRNMKVRLSWYHTTQQINAGEKWQLQVRLKRPRGFMNPGGLDYEQWLFQRGIRATGYIVDQMTDGQSKTHVASGFSLRSSKIGEQGTERMNHKILEAPPISFLKLRDQLRQKLMAHFQNQPSLPFLLAILVGDRSLVEQTQWNTLRRTGTNHLIAIAGLHVGLVTSVTYFLFAFLWRRIPRLPLYFSTPQAGAVASWLAAFFYSALAGFSLPTQRALIMLTVVLGGILMKRIIAPGYSICLALLSVLLLNPLNVLDTGFWLSFSCVSFIVYGMRGRPHATGFWWKWGRVQWVIGVGLLPLMLWSFYEASLVSPFANGIAVPWFGLVILPLSFFGGILLLLHLEWGFLLLNLALKNLDGLWHLLTLFTKLPVLSWHQNLPSVGLFLFLVLAVLLWLSPRGFPARYLSFVFLLPLLTFAPRVPKEGEMWFTVFDVGQGLSAMVQTAHHRLVYDAGPKFNDEFDMGSAVVVPYFRYAGFSSLDALMISHGDMDHRGGAESILKMLSVKEILTSVPQDFPNSAAQYCHQGQQWVWDKVQFQVIWPRVGDYDQDNNSSCVLKVTDIFGHSVLLTGDIEAPAETQLVKQPIKSTLLIAPHHGSHTSSSWPFIQAVDPAVVIYSTGYHNHFHFPHPSVIARYQKIGAIAYNTAFTGAIQFFFSQNSNPLQPVLYRIIHRHIWDER